MKHQNYKIGNIIEVLIENDKKVIGLTLGEPFILLFKKIYPKSGKINLDEILSDEIWFYCSVALDDDTLKEIKNIGNIEIDDTYINSLPPLFHQALVEKNNCTLIYLNGIEKKVAPKECVGLESASVWPGKLWLNRINDQIKNVKNIHFERSKVKL